MAFTHDYPINVKIQRNKWAFLAFILLLTSSLLFLGMVQPAEASGNLGVSIFCAWNLDNGQNRPLGYPSATNTTSSPLSPSSPNALITSLLSDLSHKHCWIETLQNKNQRLYVTNRSHHSIALTVSTSIKTTGGEGPPDSVPPIMFSKSLQSNSPPGITPRL